jgi:integrase
MTAVSQKEVVMRIKNDFSVFKRTLPSGMMVYYYQCYDEDGKRTNGRSTGEVKRTLAIAYCMKLYREGKLIPEKKGPTFGEFAQGWYDGSTCKYLQWRVINNNPVSKNTVAMQKGSLINHLLPYFADMRLNEVSKKHIDSWFVYMTDKKLKTSSIHVSFYTLKTMMDEAVRRDLIAANPLDRVKELKIKEKEMEILRPEEVRSLFPAQWDMVWDDYTICLANKLMAFTGMRLGELLGLRGEYVFDDYIRVCGQYTRHGYGETKTRENRDIPITKLIRSDLEDLIAINGMGYLFSEDGGEKPLPRTKMYVGFKAALERIGINKAERERRGITVHGWRHFLNTLLRMANVADSKVQKVTGHKSLKMTDRYTHFNTQEFNEVRDVQENLLKAPELKGKQAVEPKKRERTEPKKQKSGKKAG